MLNLNNYAEKCSFCEKGDNNVYTLIIPFEVYKEWCYLIDLCDTEFLLVFNYEEMGENKFKIKNYRIPLQEVSSVSAEKKEESMNEFNGILHSHVNMGVFESKDDMDTHQNYMMCIIMNKQKKMLCKIKYRLPCNMGINLQVQNIIVENMELEKLKKKDLREIMEKNVIDKVYTEAHYSNKNKPKDPVKSYSRWGIYGRKYIKKLRGDADENLEDNTEDLFEDYLDEDIYSC